VGGRRAVVFKLDITSDESRKKKCYRAAAAAVAVAAA